MAELVMGKLGAAAGKALLPPGLSFLGASIGRLAGAALDARFLSPPIEGPRVKDFHLTGGHEGAGVPIVYGRYRIGAQLIWAANFKERRDVEGGKGGPWVADYSYSLSFAVGLCEGEIVRVTRCWANGEPFDLSRVTWRLYRGTEDQAPDPLIATIEGEAPAYRGLAYIVFEDMPVDQFGARMPQLSFEVLRSVGSAPDRMERITRAVNLIPGSGEFVLATDIVRRRIGPGREVAENLHGAEQKSDWEASLDQLEAELPNVSRVNLVVSWFGTDLRCAECNVRPGVEIASKVSVPQTWSVAGVTREDAYVVSAADGRANYGGTPSDGSVKEAIAMLKARGYHVTLYPFVLMDVPPGNGLPDPHGGSEQAAFPWRGRITTIAGDVGAQVAAFFVQYGEMVRHYAHLGAEEGVDGILIGSELIGLTRALDAGAYPAVAQLCELAAEVRGIVGPGVEISYAADWTEYGAHVVGDDVAFPLDDLWAHPAIDYVGLDWYPPMADWRDGDGHADAASVDEHDKAYLSANIAGGEAFDWYYADGAGRLAQERLAITDGAYGEPWVYRQKDVRSWWSNAHHARNGGIRSATPTAWTPGLKPVRFVEMGIPAVDKGANQPNVFYDPKSSESALPHFSDGSRDDVIQRRGIEAFHAFWADAANNPVSDIYDGRMIPEDGTALWAWDTRPFPAFPARKDVWSDGGNWRLGHWLNGRTGAALLSDVVADICERANAPCDASGLVGVVGGYAMEGPLRARSVLERLVSGYGVDVTERNGELVFRMRGSAQSEIAAGRLVEDDGPALAVTRGGLEREQTAVRLRYVNAESDYAPGVVRSLGDAATDAADIELPLVMDQQQAVACAERLAEDLARRSERVSFQLAADGVSCETGDVVSVDGDSWRIVELSDSGLIGVVAVKAGPVALPIVTAAAPGVEPSASPVVEPDIAIVDAPPLPGQEDDLRPLGFAFADPWTGPVVFQGGADADQMVERGRVSRPCVMGRLMSAMSPHPSGRWQETSVWVTLDGGGLASATAAAVRNGANRALVETEAGWELIQFQEAELVDVDSYRLGGLLRGQQGSETGAGAEEGARVLFLTGAEQRLDVAEWEHGLELSWRAGLWEASATHLGVAGRQWSPAHLRVGWWGEDLAVSWIRRARKDGDSWGGGEPPADAGEHFFVRVTGGETVREWSVAGASAIYPRAQQVEDFPAGGVALVAVAQAGRRGEAGAWSSVEVVIPSI